MLFTKINTSLSNDIDCVAHAAIWTQNEDAFANYSHAFLKQIGEYTDDGKQPLNSEWHKKNSGAFLTWFRDKNAHNDVDCIVNLNILTTIANYENAGKIVSENVEQAKKIAVLF